MDFEHRGPGLGPLRQPDARRKPAPVTEREVCFLMADFKTHITTSTVLGVGYGTAGVLLLDVPLANGLLAGGLYLGRARREERRLEAYIDDEVADLLGIREILGESGAALPYGLRKRVELARAIAMEPRLLLLDEPAAGLGHGDREQMMRLTRDLQRLHGITVLLVEHDMHVVMDLADQVVVLDFGRVIAAGTPEQVREDPAVIAAYLGAEAEQAS